MSDAGGTVWVVFNGEIYNFHELKKELTGYGYVFRTNSDTEVIVNGYKRWGVEVLNHLNGMFGLAIWDNAKQRFMAARDRLGIKPFYYHLDNAGITFASELRALTSVSTGKFDVDPVAMNLFLRYRYIPSPLTILKRVCKLPPGHRLIIEKGAVRLERWWVFDPCPFSSKPSFEEAEEHLAYLYKRAVARQLTSDVPVGLLLSGGVDSGLLLALMKSQDEPWKTFSIGFGSDFRHDELSAAKKTADCFGAQNIPVLLDKKTFENSFTKIIEALEEPVAATSVIPMYHLCGKTREHVKVALVGQGPDEFFGGYKRHLGVYYGKYWRLVPESLQQKIGCLLKCLPRNAAISRALYSLNEPSRERRYQQVFSILQGEVANALFHAGQIPETINEKVWECWNYLRPVIQNTDELGGFQVLELRSALPDELLMYSDKLSMAHGLEVRVPYLDHDIVEYVERLPAEYKIRFGKRKWLHRKICRKMLPHEITGRKKLGFHTPVDQWLRESFNKKTDKLLRHKDVLVYEYLKPDLVKKIIHEHATGKFNHYKTIFSFMALEDCLTVLQNHHSC